MSELPVYNAEHSNPIVNKMIKLGKRSVASVTRVSFNRLLVGCPYKNSIQTPFKYYWFLNGTWMVHGLFWPMVFEWYLNVFEWYFAFFVPFSGVEWYFKLPLWVPLSPAEILLNDPTVLNYTEWYSMIISGIPLALISKGAELPRKDSLMPSPAFECYPRGAKQCCHLTDTD